MLKGKKQRHQVQQHPVLVYEHSAKQTDKFG